MTFTKSSYNWLDEALHSFADWEATWADNIDGQNLAVLEKIFENFPTTQSSPAPTPVTVPADCTVLGNGVLAIDKCGVYWPGFPGKTGFKVLTLKSPDLAPYVLCALTDTLEAPVATDGGGRQFWLNRFYYGYGNEVLISDPDVARTIIRSVVVLAASWPIFWFARFGKSSLDDQSAEELLWLDLILSLPASGITVSGDDEVDASSPLMPALAVNVIYGAVSNPSAVASESKLIEVMGIPLRPDGTPDIGVVSDPAKRNLLSSATGATRSWEGSYEEITAPTATFLNAFDDVLRIWERRILKQEKGMTKVTGTTVMISVPMLQAQRDLLRKFGTFTGPKSNVYDSLIATLDKMIITLVERATPEQSGRRTRMAGWRLKDATKQALVRWRQDAGTANVPTYRVEEADQLRRSLGRPNDPDVPVKMKKVRILVPKSLSDLWKQRMRAIKKNIATGLKSTDPIDREQYQDWMYFFVLVAMYTYAHYLVPSRFSDYQQGLPSGDLSSKFMERTAKLIGLYADDNLNNPNYSKARPWHIDDTERAMLLRAVKSIDVAGTQDWS